FAKRFERLVQYRPVRGSILPAGHVPKDLLDHALLASRRPGEKLAEFSWAREFRALNSGDLPFRVQIQVDLLGFGAPPRNSSEVRIKKQLVLFAAHPDGVKLFESEADRIDEIVAPGAHLVAGVHR